MGEHRAFAESVASKILEKKRLTFANYLMDMALNTTPFDEIALLCCARMFKVHFTIINNKWWFTTRRGYSTEESTVTLAFRGQLRFDILLKRDALKSRYKEPDAYFEPDADDLYRIQQERILQEEEAAKAKGPKMKIGRGKPKGHARKQHVPAPSTSGYVTGVRTRSKGLEDTAPQTPVAVKPRTSQTSKRAGSLSLPESQPKRRKVSGKSQGKADPLLHVADEPQAMPRRSNRRKQPKQSAVSVAKTNDGAIQVKQYAIRKTSKKELKLKCPRPKCKQRFPSQKQLNNHLRKFHPKFTYKCKYCPRTFFTYNGHYKHEKDHLPSRWVCDFCGKEVQFRHQWTIHRRKHTGRQKYPCTHCSRTFTTNTLMKRHAVKHTEEQFKCQQCSFSADTPGAIYQHTRGKHGSGWVSHCGVRFAWPAKRVRHQKKCQQCKEKERANRQAEILQRSSAMLDQEERRKGKKPRKDAPK